jgi:hypothetical protein
MANTADTTDRGHPISVLVSRFEDELKTLRNQPAWSMGPEETDRLRHCAHYDVHQSARTYR